MKDVAGRFLRGRKLAAAAAGLAAAFGLALPATAARAGTAGYAPPPAEWWTTSWRVSQQVWPVTEGAGSTVAVLASRADAGTVAELIAGQGTGGGPVGLAPHARILPVRVDEPGPASAAAVPAGIRYAAEHGATVINLSLGIPYPSSTWCDPAMQAAVSYALSRNIVIVAGAGDTNLTGKRPVEPASCSGVLAVGGIEPTGRLWPNSTREPYVSVAAPADRIPVSAANGKPGTGSGTSFAAPLVAATAALIRSKYPKMPWYQVDQRIIATATAVPPAESNDYGYGYGYGILNVAKAVDAAKYPVPASAPNPPYTRYVDWLNTLDGQAWAQANGVTVPSPEGTTAAGTSVSWPQEVLSRNRVAALIVAAVVVLLVAVAVALLLLRSRRKRRLEDVAVPDLPVAEDSESISPEQAAQS